VERNANKAFVTMNLLATIGVNPYGFNKFLSNCLYTQMVHAEMKYGLAINRFTSSQIKAMEDVQVTYLCQIYGVKHHTSTKVMYHVAQLPSMRERINILPIQLLLYSFFLSEDKLSTLLLLPLLN
jgi:hypothetical protein